MAILSRDKSSPLSSYSSSFPAGTHALAIYTDKISKINEAFRFLREGYEAGESAFLITDDLSKEDIWRRIGNEWPVSGATSSSLENVRDIKIATASEWYFPNGSLDFSDTMAKWSSIVNAAVKSKKKGLRIFADAAEFFRNGLHEALLDYELSLPKIFNTKATTLCAYECKDLASLSPKELVELSDHHLVLHMGASDYAEPKTMGRIMVVDDEPDIAYFVREGLKLRQFAVDIFTDSDEALAHLKGNEGIYSLVISDIRMPGTTGLDLLEQIKAMNSKTKVILMTANEIDEIVSKGTTKILPSAEPDLILSKPFNLEKLWSGTLRVLVEPPSSKFS